jgi:hypothetical protein
LIIIENLQYYIESKINKVQLLEIVKRVLVSPILLKLLLTVLSSIVCLYRLCKLQKRYTRLAAASDKVYQLLAHGRWFSPGTPASSTTKTGRHDIAEILLKVALSTKNQIIVCL